MMIGSGCVHVFCYCLFIFATQNFSQAKPMEDYSYYLRSGVQSRAVEKTYFRSAAVKNIPLIKLLSLAKAWDALIEEHRNKCLLIFSSAFGTKDEKIKCLMNLKKKRVQKQMLEEVILNRNILGKPSSYNFVDLTRVADALADKNGIQRSEKVPNTQSFSTDYIDFDTLRTELGEENLYTDHTPYYLRRSNYKPHQRTADASSEQDSADSTDGMAIKYTKRSRPKKPKRFQVITNKKDLVTSDSNESYKKDVVSSSASSLEDEPLRDHRQKRPVQTDSEATSSEEILEDNEKKVPYSDSFSEDTEEIPKRPRKKKVLPKYVVKYTEPLKTKEDFQKDVYLQGNKLIDLDGRRQRLPHFMPKRSFWEEDDIHKLGYFWFNGPQGKYAHFRERP